MKRLPPFDERASAQFREYDLDHPEPLPSLHGRPRRVSPSSGPEKSLNGSKRMMIADLIRSTSPPSDSERASPRTLGFGPSQVRKTTRSDWWESSRPMTEIPDFVGIQNGYGSYQGKGPPEERPSKVSRFDVNGRFNERTTARNWQNTEEEEYDWKDMSPMLSERGRSNWPRQQSFSPIDEEAQNPAFGVRFLSPPLNF